MRTLVVTLAVGAMAGAAGADVITQWNFNGSSATTVPGGASSPTPSVGIGTASLFGAVTATFASGISNGGSSDPVTTSPPNFGWNITTFAAQGSGDGTRGTSYAVSTVGYNNVIVTWDQRHSNTSSRYARFEYTLDGSTYGTAGLANGGVFIGDQGDTWFNNRTVDLSSIAGAANNASFGFRVVAIFDPNLGNAYTASNSASSYAASGTWRFDMVTVSGSLVPTPGAMALMGLAAITARRRRS